MVYNIILQNFKTERNVILGDKGEILSKRCDFDIYIDIDITSKSNIKLKQFQFCKTGDFKAKC